MNYPKDYLDDILVRMAYHSSGIEGNTISLPETVSIILEGTLPDKRKSIREFYEIENHKEAFQYILSCLAQPRPLNLEIVKNVHALLTDRLQYDRGQFKTTQNAIIGAEFKTATPYETPQLMQQWADNTDFRLRSATTVEEKLCILADTHIQFERIHPFSDGNGRTGRLLMMYLSMKHLDAPVIISKTSRAAYINHLADQNINSLSELLKESLENELTRMTEFKH